MKRKLRTIAKSLKGKERVLVTLLFAFVLSSMSIGYAYYQTQVSLEANITLLKGELEITEASQHTNKNASVTGDIDISRNENNNTVVLLSEYTAELTGNSNDNYVTVRYEVENNSRFTYTFTNFSYLFSDYDGANPIDLRAPKLYGLIPGDKLAPGETRTVDLTYLSSASVGDTTFTVIPSFIFDSSDPEVAIPTLQGALDAKKITLKDDDMASVALKVVNGFDTTVGYTLSLSTDKYVLTNNSGVEDDYFNLLEPGANTKDTIYIKLVDDSVAEEATTTNLIATLEDGTEYVLDTFTIGRNVITDLPYMKVVTNTEKSHINTGWGRYILHIDITNNYEVPINKFTVYIYPKDTSSVANAGSYDNTVTYEDGIIKMTSKVINQNSFINIDPGETYTSGEILVEYVQGKTFEVDHYEVYAVVENINASADGIYRESILNGADPVFPENDNNFIPVVISNNGTVRRARASEQWYKYASGQWANAVILKTNNRVNWYYPEGETINPNDIDNYVVWIPRYKYKLFNVTTTNAVVPVQVIQVSFETTDVAPSTGSTNGTYLTHPAFTAINKNGFWIGKFESTNNWRTLPNVTAIRNQGIADLYMGMINYKTALHSHLVTNMEWGATGYLAHSKYGKGTTKIEMNGNSQYRTGCSNTNNASNTQCVNAYGSATSYPQSTTGNISGVFDMSGGSFEYVAATVVGERAGDYSTMYDTIATDLLGDGLVEPKDWFAPDGQHTLRSRFNDSDKYYVRGSSNGDGARCTIFNYWHRNGDGSGNTSGRIAFDI